MVFGTAVQIVDPAHPLGHNEVIPVEVFVAAVTRAGYGGAGEAAAVVLQLSDAGYDIPSAWLEVVRGELTGVGITPGRVNALIAEMQKVCAQLCGVAYVRVLGGSEKL